MEEARGNEKDGELPPPLQTRGEGNPIDKEPGLWL